MTEPLYLLLLYTVGPINSQSFTVTYFLIAVSGP